MSAIVFYSDDTFWHERMLLFPLADGRWVVYTPDGDYYIEAVKGDSPEDGPTHGRLLEADFGLPRDVRAPAYRFKNYPDPATFKSLLREGFKLALQEDGDNVMVVKEILDTRGRIMNLDEYFGGNFLVRRLRGKGGIVKKEVTTRKTKAEKDETGDEDEKEDDGDEAALPLRVTSVPDDILEKMHKAIYPAPVGQAWIAVELIGQFFPGLEVKLNAHTDFCIGTHTALILREGRYVKCELMKIGEIPGIVDEIKGGLVKFMKDQDPPGGEDDGRGEKKEIEKIDEEATGAEDVRTTWIDFDEEGKRFKDWRRVVADSKSHDFKDWPHEGPLSCLRVMTHMFRHGGTPKLWMQLWMKNKNIHENDRVAHEMRVLVECLEFGGGYDQLNMPCLASFETICRRLQSIVDAYEKSTNGTPDWGNAKLFSGHASPDDLVAPSLRTWAAKRGKEEVELWQARAKMRELRQPPFGGGGAEQAAAGAAADGVLPGRGPKGPKGLRKGQKGLEAPEAK